MIGVDVVSIKRLNNIISAKNGKHFINKTFTDKEKDYFTNKHDMINHVATTFAAKEAVFKALGTGLGETSDVEIIREKNGKPIVRLYGKTKKLVGRKKVFVNMSYDGDYAFATAIIR